MEYWEGARRDAIKEARATEKRRKKREMDKEAKRRKRNMRRPQFS